MLLTVATGYFVAQEFAYVAVDRSALKHQAEQGNAAAQRALQVTDRLSFTLSGAQFGITVTAILVGYVAEPFIGSGAKDTLQDLGIAPSLGNVIATTATLLFATVVQMILGELAPKNWAIARSQALALALSRSTLLYLAFAGPVIKIFDAAATKILRKIGIEPAEEIVAAATPDDLAHIIAESGEAGLLDADTSRLLQRGLDFHELTVRSAMIPRINVTVINASKPVAEVVDLLESGHTRFPVVGDGIDDLLGTISIADLARVEPHERALITVASLRKPAFVLPESISLSAALEHMREKHHQLACITDEHGAFTGVLTLEDIAEELVGEIQDEDDPDEPGAIQSDDGAWTLPAKWRLDELEQATGIQLPHSDNYETINGAILEHLGRLPEVGDVIEIPQVPPSTFSESIHMSAVITVKSVEHGVAAIIHVATRPMETNNEGNNP